MESLDEEGDRSVRCESGNTEKTSLKKTVD